MFHNDKQQFIIDSTRVFHIEKFYYRPMHFPKNVTFKNVYKVFQNFSNQTLKMYKLINSYMIKI